MNDVLVIALVASVAPTLAAGGTFLFNVYNAIQVRKLHDEERAERAANRAIADAAAKALATKTDEVASALAAKTKVIEEKIDGRLSQLLESTRKESYATGVIQGAEKETAAQGVRDAAVVVQIEQAKAEMPDASPPVLELTTEKPSVTVTKKP